MGERLGAGPRLVQLQPDPEYQRGVDGSLTPEREAVLARLAGRRRVLDVGCARGLFAAVLRDRGHEVVGIEADPRLAREARGRGVAVAEGDAEDPAVWAGVGGGFDAVVFLHVLEHLADPWEALRRARDALAPGGVVLSLVPNVAAWRVRRDLFFRGRFEYAASGILDRTHLRFFTLASAAALHRDAGFSAVGWWPVQTWVPGEAHLRHRLGMGRLARRWHDAASARWPNLCTEVALFEARP